VEEMRFPVKPVEIGRHPAGDIERRLEPVAVHLTDARSAPEGLAPVVGGTGAVGPAGEKPSQKEIRIFCSAGLELKGRFQGPAERRSKRPTGGRVDAEFFSPGKGIKQPFGGNAIGCRGGLRFQGG
jgi:hypothetical protein